MANFEVPENPEFTEGIRKMETTDPGHAGIFNAVFEPIINNVLHVRKMITDHKKAKNPHGIKPEDLGLENVENKPMGELSTEFTMAGTRSNIQSGQAMKTVLGMLSRWYTDLKTVAWSGKYNDLTNKPTIPNGAAASCAVANNDTTTAAGSVADARIVRQHGLEIDEINSDLAGYKFGKTTDGKPGYIVPGGADTVLPFSAGELYFLGRYGGSSSVNINITKYANYKDLTVQNFIGYSLVNHCKYIDSDRIGQVENNHASAATSMGYNSSTGILTFNSPVNHTTGSGDDYSRVKYLQTDLYLYTGEIKFW